jgi:hypothetical protein
MLRAAMAMKQCFQTAKPTLVQRLAVVQRVDVEDEEVDVDAP